MSDTSVQSIVVSAGPDLVAQVICDFERYPQWATGVKAVEILEEYEDGYASQVRFVVDAAAVTDEYTLAYEYAEDISRIEWHLVAPSRMQKSQVGAYDIVDRGGGSCTVTYTLAVEPTVPMLGMFKRRAEKMIMDTALAGLKRRVESTAGAA